MEINIRRKSIAIITLIVMMLCVSCSESKQVINNSTNTSISGQWETILKDDTDLTLIINEEEKSIYLTSNSEGCKFYQLYVFNWGDEEIKFSIPRGAGELNFNVKLEKGKLVGNCEYYDEKEKVSFTKISDNYTVGEGETEEFNKSVSKLKKQITDYSQYEEDGLEYQFTYEPESKELCEEIIKKYELNTIVEGKEDIELMETLLNWECDLLDHSSTNIAKSQDIKSLIEDGLINGVNCRGLSIILNELLRMYGIKSHIITCLPKENVFFDCHVVVQAYSEKLGQWIMLDPTYNLILKDENGEYLDIQRLRNCIVNDTKVYWNDSAGYNGGSMSESKISDYLYYMAKNSFVYVKKISGGEVVLVSKNYKKAKEYFTPSHTIYTTDENKFWGK